MFEIHVTVKSERLLSFSHQSVVEKFREDCEELGCKPILIEFPMKVRRDPDQQKQLMTAQSYMGTFWEEELNKIKTKISAKGYRIDRLKVEINPNVDFGVPIKYLETHFRIKITDHRVKDELKRICKKYEFHLSRNAFKTFGDYYYLMCTYRTHNVNLSNFNQHISQFKAHLDLEEIIYDKVEIEGCILDTNEELDNYWLK